MKTNNAKHFEAFMKMDHKSDIKKLFSKMVQNFCKLSDLKTTRCSMLHAIFGLVEQKILKLVDSAKSKGTIIELAVHSATIGELRLKLAD